MNRCKALSDASAEACSLVRRHLAYLGWTAATISLWTGYSTHEVHAWMRYKEAPPQSILDWLDRARVAHASNPPPKKPR